MNDWELSPKGRKLGFGISIGIYDAHTSSQCRIHLGIDIIGKLKWYVGDFINIEVGSGSNLGKIRLSIGGEEYGHYLGQDATVKTYFRLTWGNYPREWTREPVGMTKVNKIVGNDYIILEVPSLICQVNPE